MGGTYAIEVKSKDYPDSFFTYAYESNKIRAFRLVEELLLKGKEAIVKEYLTGKILKNEKEVQRQSN
mgnify:FL=1